MERIASETSRQDTCPCPWPVTGARLSDIHQIVNLVVDAAGQHHFSPRFQDIRYQAGLARQLFTTQLFGGFSEPLSRRCPANLNVVKSGPTLLGFCWLRQLNTDGPASPTELYMMGVDPDHRRHGVARALLSATTRALQPGQSLLVPCLPASVGMKRLLKSMGAQSLGQPRRSSTSQVPVEVFCLGQPPQWPQMPGQWPYTDLPAARKTKQTGQG